MIFGACAFWDVSQSDADRTLELVFEQGINHIDTAASYNHSEKRLGPWLKHHRDAFFLATKTDKRTHGEALEELFRSLDRLQTDHIDLWQMHCLIDPVEWATAMGPDGVVEAFLEARGKGLVKYLGVTGHGVGAPAMHLQSLERFDFDSVLLPYNYPQMQLPGYAADFLKLLETCRKRNIAVQTIKSIARGNLGEEQKVFNMWYAPLGLQPAINRAVHWVLGNPQVFLNTPADITLLPKVIEAAKEFGERPSDEMMETDRRQYRIEPLFT